MTGHSSRIDGVKPVQRHRRWPAEVLVGTAQEIDEPSLSGLMGCPGMADCLWAFLPEDHGKISDFAFEESRKAVISYLSNYLPGELMPKGSQL